LGRIYPTLSKERTSEVAPDRRMEKIAGMLTQQTKAVMTLVFE
jgi:hypothetical protein